MSSIKKTQGAPDFIDVASRAGAFGIQRAYLQTRTAGTYPEAFVGAVEDKRSDWVIIADVQTSTFTKFFGSDWNDIQAAFDDFGQGTLLDTRPGREGDEIHMMDTGAAPPVGYHRWHASIRAIQLLGIGDISWWERLDALVGLAWAIQSFARPRQQDVPNPPILQSDLQKLHDAWLPMSSAMRDAQFDLPAGQSSGYHPSPFDPAPMA